MFEGVSKYLCLCIVKRPRVSAIPRQAAYCRIPRTRAFATPRNFDFQIPSIWIQTTLSRPAAFRSSDVVGIPKYHSYHGGPSIPLQLSSFESYAFRRRRMLPHSRVLRIFFFFFYAIFLVSPAPRGGCAMRARLFPRRMDRKSRVIVRQSGQTSSFTNPRVSLLRLLPREKTRNEGREGGEIYARLAGHYITRFRSLPFLPFPAGGDSNVIFRRRAETGRPSFHGREGGGVSYLSLLRF